MWPYIKYRYTRRTCSTTTSIDSVLIESIMKCCLDVSKNCIPNVGFKIKHDMIGWSDQLAHKKDRSLLWHWIWCESGKPNSGFIYDIMKRTRHQYHYAIRCCTKNN